MIIADSTSQNQENAMIKEDIKEVLDDHTIPHLDFDRCFIYRDEEGSEKYVFIIRKGKWKFHSLLLAST